MKQFFLFYYFSTTLGVRFCLGKCTKTYKIVLNEVKYSYIMKSRIGAA